MMTQPIIARLYIDRQRQWQHLEDTQAKLEDAARAVLALHPARREYGTDEDYGKAITQYNEWLARIEELIYELEDTSAAIADSLSAPDAHLKGYPK